MKRGEDHAKPSQRSTPDAELPELPRHAIIFGGIHGNELSGVYAVKKWQKEGAEVGTSNDGRASQAVVNISKEQPPSLQRAGLSVRCILANPPAVRECRRFIDSDLNAAFNKEDAEADARSNSEAELARELERGLSSSSTAFCLTLHGSTSNCGIMLLVAPDDKIALQAAASVKSRLESHPVHIVLMHPKPHSLRSLFASGIGIEAGPQPQGLLLTEMLTLHENVIHLVLDYLSGLAPIGPNSELEVFLPKEVVPFPKDENGEISASIHSEFQDKDFCKLSMGVKIFKNFNGSDILYGDEDTYPLFINEAAYYTRNSAFLKSNKVILDIS